MAGIQSQAASRFIEHAKRMKECLLELEREEEQRTQRIAKQKQRLAEIENEIDRKTKEKGSHEVARRESRYEEESSRVRQLKEEVKALGKQCEETEQRITAQSQRTADKHGFKFVNSLTRKAIGEKFANLQKTALLAVDEMSQSSMHVSSTPREGHSPQEAVLSFFGDILRETVYLAHNKMKGEEDSLNSVILKAAGLSAVGDTGLSFEDRSRLRDLFRHQEAPESQDVAPDKFRSERLNVESALCKGSLTFEYHCRKLVGYQDRLKLPSQHTFTAFAQECANFAWSWLIFPSCGELSFKSKAGDRKARFKDEYYRTYNVEARQDDPVTVLWPVLVDTDQVVLGKGLITKLI